MLAVWYSTQIQCNFSLFIVFCLRARLCFVFYYVNTHAGSVLASFFGCFLSSERLCVVLLRLYTLRLTSTSAELWSISLGEGRMLCFKVFSFLHLSIHFSLQSLFRCCLFVCLPDAALKSSECRCLINISRGNFDLSNTKREDEVMLGWAVGSRLIVQKGAL